MHSSTFAYVYKDCTLTMTLRCMSEVIRSTMSPVTNREGEGDHIPS